MLNRNRVFGFGRRVAALVALSPCFAFAGITDCVVDFSTPGIDRYADGRPVEDGECYALVWSPKGKAFSGFNVDGTAVSSADRVVLAAPLAMNGCCPRTIFQIPAEEYEELKGGEWTVCLVDTRMSDGFPAGVADNAPLRVNSWGAVKGGVREAPSSISNLRLAASSGAKSGSTTGGVRSGASDDDTTIQPVRANNVSSLPPSIKPPTITAIEIQDGEVWLAVADTVPYLSYTIISGKEPGDLKTDYFSEVVDGDAGGEIAIGTVQSPTRRFFKVKRTE
jgi:hypothetical protein